MERNIVFRALECNDFYLDTTKFSPSKLIEVEAVRNACNNGNAPVEPVRVVRGSIYQQRFQ